MNLYNLLGLDEKATEEEIKQRYKSLIRKYHPDNNLGDPNATTRFTEIREAYQQILKERSDSKRNQEKSEPNNAEVRERVQDNVAETDGKEFCIRQELMEAYKCIKSSDYYKASVLLSEVDNSSRDVQWLYLKALVEEHVGNYETALGYARRVCEIDSTVSEYRHLLRRLNGQEETSDIIEKGNSIVAFFSILLAAIVCFIFLHSMF